MLEHIYTLADRIIGGQVGPFGGVPEIFAAIEPLRAEDFLPDDRADFMAARAALRAINTEPRRQADPARVKEALRHLVEVLKKYPGPATSKKPRAFPFITSDKLREIVERDYSDLALRLLPSESWKSAVIMAGSILEAILHDQLTRDAGRIAAANGCPDAAKKKGGIVKDIASTAREDEWPLASLIRVSAALGIIPVEREAIFDHTLREYRNFVHPRVEVRTEFGCGQSEASLAKAVLDIICDHLSAAVD